MDKPNSLSIVWALVNHLAKFVFKDLHDYRECCGDFGVEPDGLVEQTNSVLMPKAYLTKAAACIISSICATKDLEELSISVRAEIKEREDIVNEKIKDTKKFIATLMEDMRQEMNESGDPQWNDDIPFAVVNSIPQWDLRQEANQLCDDTIKDARADVRSFIAQLKILHGHNFCDQEPENVFCKPEKKCQQLVAI